MKHKFYKLGDNTPVDLITYIETYMREKPATKIYVGCDSQNGRKNTQFAIVIVLHNGNKGGHVLYTKLSVPKLRDKFYRLFMEASYSLEVAEFIKNETGRVADYIDVDLNPDPKFQSNAVLAQAVGMITGSGYEARYKPNAMSASYAADRLAKS